MKIIELKEYEVNDLVRTLEYAKNKKREEYNAGKFSKNQFNFELGDWQEDFALSLEELQAINKQVEELGWNE